MEYRKAIEDDFDMLVALRIRAMKPSLEKIGRFDVTRATERFRKSFIPDQTTIALKDGELFGFYMVIERDDELFLNHLYIDPQYQGKRIGTKLLNQVKDMARSSNKGIKLEALKESRSNSFYVSNGFIKIGESEWEGV